MIFFNWALNLNMLIMLMRGVAGGHAQNELIRGEMQFINLVSLATIWLHCSRQFHWLKQSNRKWKVVLKEIKLRGTCRWVLELLKFSQSVGFSKTQKRQFDCVKLVSLIIFNLILLVCENQFDYCIFVVGTVGIFTIRLSLRETIWLGQSKKLHVFSCRMMKMWIENSNWILKHDEPPHFILWPEGNYSKVMYLIWFK